MSAHAEIVVQWLSQNWLWVVLWAWILGGFEEAGRWWRRVQRRRQHALEARRKHELKLAKAKAHGQRMAQPYIQPRVPLPAPSERTEPGPCPHPTLVPVVGSDGVVKRFVCGNLLCEATFPPDTVIYEPDDDTDQH